MPLLQLLHHKIPMQGYMEWGKLIIHFLTLVNIIILVVFVAERASGRRCTNIIVTYTALDSIKA